MKMHKMNRYFVSEAFKMSGCGLQLRGGVPVNLTEKCLQFFQSLFCYFSSSIFASASVYITILLFQVCECFVMPP